MNKMLNKHLIFNTALMIRGEWMYRELSFLYKSQFFSAERLKELQDIKLKKLFHHARKRSKFYQRRLPEKIDLDNIGGVDFIDKSILRRHAENMLTTSKHLCRKKTTGGSTGAAVTIYKNAEEMKAEYAAAWRGYHWTGISVGDRQVRFWGIPQSIVGKIRAKSIDFVCNRYRVSAFGYDLGSWEQYIDDIKDFNPDYFYGYVSIIRNFSEYLKNFKGFHGIKPRCIIPTSEVLTPIDRKLFSDTFSCPVFNEYGCGEFNTIAHECQSGSLHINAENLLVEIVDNRGNILPPGCPGEIVVTDLNNLTMPLIRYKLEDRGMLSKNLCSCGRSLPVIEKVFGRAYDSLVNSQGKLFHGEFFLYIIEDAKKNNLPVDGVQFVQKENGQLSVHVACRNDIFYCLSDFIKKRLRVDFDPKLTPSIKKVKRIEREESGKLRVVKREKRINVS